MTETEKQHKTRLNAAAQKRRLQNANAEPHEAIRSAIESCDQPLSPAELHDAARIRVPRIALATTQRAISDLLTNGWLRAVDVPNAPTRYERAGHPSSLNDRLRPHHLDDNDSGRCFIPARRAHDGVPASALPSRDESLHHLAAMHRAIEAVRRQLPPHPSWVVLPPGLDRSVLATLPFRVRTCNCFKSAELLEGDGPVTVADLLELPNFGRVSLHDVLFVVESFLKERVRTGPPDAPPLCATNGTTATAPSDSPTPAEQHDSKWSDGPAALLSALLNAAAEFHGATTLADVLDPETIRLASVVGLLNDIRAVKIEDMPDGPPRLSSVVSSTAAQIHTAMTPAQRTVVDLRLLASPPRPLREVGLLLEVTRERVRQVQARIERQIDTTIGAEIRIIATVIRNQLGPVVRQTALNARIEELLPGDGTTGAALARYALESELGYSLINGVCLDAAGSRMLDQVHAMAKRLTDDAGLIDEPTLLSSLSGEAWRTLWPLLRECCSFHNLFGSLATRDSAKARTKAALLHIGAPATREEIAELCGVSPTQAGGYLSNISDVVRADKSRWGLADWIDDEYEGITAEIIQRVEEDGGVTPAERLFDEIPAKFGVRSDSVHAYLQTPKFVVRDGYVSVADPSSLKLRDLDDVIEGRDERDAPYWTFMVEERHFRGYSLSGVPPEFVKHAGCAPDRALRVSIANPADCPDLSVRWPLSAINGATIGYLAAPLKSLGVRSGDRVRVTIVKPGTVELTAESAGPSPYSVQPNSVVTRMKNRRKIL